MSTNSELLQLAAKAAGFQYAAFSERLGLEVWNDEMESSKFWNPLEDDGDAMRLAVKLRLCISHEECDCCVWCSPGLDSMGDGDACAIERMRDAGNNVELQDRATATRRAIVRAAAEIGSTS